MVIGGNDRNIIKGNTIVKAGGDGINGFSDDTGSNQILDNTIIASGRDGVFVNGKRNVIQGNTINQSGESGIEVYSFTFNETPSLSEGVIIKDNSITNSNVGITIIDASLNTVVIGNTFAGNTDGPIDDNGTDTVFVGNVPNLM